MGIEATRFASPEFPASPDAILAYVSAVFEEGDPASIALALNALARAKGLGQVPLTAHSDIASVIGMLKAIGLELTVKVA